MSCIPARAHGVLMSRATGRAFAMTSLQTVERELELHAGALRALARALVSNPDAADDVVQETALRALCAPPHHADGMFGWLATTLRNLASKSRRAQVRRDRRERLAARPEAVPPPERALAQRESLRKVTEAVLALPEPYQTALVLRYYQNLTPTAIAARTNTPLATVKSRQQRGLVLLRAELDRSDRTGRWRQALLATTGMAAPAKPLLLTTGTLLMAPTAKLAFLAGAALVGAVLLFVLGGEPPAPPPALVSAVPAPIAASTEVEVESAAPAQLRREEAAPAASLPPALDLAHPYQFELRCRVIDRDGLPVRGAQVFLAPQACALNTWPELSGDDGSVVVRWRGRQETMWITLGVRRSDLNQLLRQVEVRAGAQREIVLLGEQRQQGTFHLAMKHSADSRAKGTVSFLLQALDDSGCENAGAAVDCRGCHQGPQVRGVFDVRLKMRGGLHPEATFADLLLPRASAELLAAKPELIDAEVGSVVEGAGHASGAVVSLIGRSPPPTAALGRIVGRVFAADGAPAAGVTVAWGRDLTRQANRTRTSKDGSFAIDGAPAGSIDLRCGGGDLGQATTVLSVVERIETRADVLLRLGAVIQGHALGRDGAPLAGWRVEYIAHDESWSDACTVRDDGTFVLPNLTAGGGKLLLWPKQGTQLPAAIESSVLADVAEVVFDLRQRGEPRGGIRLRALLPPGVTDVAAEARVWQNESGRGAVMELTQEGAFVLAGLAAGFYRVEIGGEAVGWRDLGQHWVDGKRVCDLGVTELPRPGRVHVTRAEGIAEPPELYARRLDGDVRAEDVARGVGDTLLLPAGQWLALWRVGKEEIAGEVFTVPTAGTVELRLDHERSALK